MDTGWYYAAGAERFGPFTQAQMEGLLRSGALRPDALVWHDGLPAWTAAADALGLRERAPGEPPPIPTATAPPAPAPPPPPTYDYRVASSYGEAAVPPPRSTAGPGATSGLQHGALAASTLYLLILLAQAGELEPSIFPFFLALALAAWAGAFALAVAGLVGADALKRHRVWAAALVGGGASPAALFILLALFEESGDAPPYVLFLLATAAAQIACVVAELRRPPGGPARGGPSGGDPGPGGARPTPGGGPRPAPAFRPVAPSPEPGGGADANEGPRVGRLEPAEQPAAPPTGLPERPAGPGYGPVGGSPATAGAVPPALSRGRSASFPAPPRRRRPPRSRDALALGATCALALVVLAATALHGRHRAAGADERVAHLARALTAHGGDHLATALDVGAAASAIAEAGGDRRPVEQAFGSGAASHVRALAEAHRRLRAAEEGGPPAEAHRLEGALAEAERRYEAVRASAGAMEQRGFLVGSRFDTMGDGRGAYEAIDEDETHRRVVLLGRDGEVGAYGETVWLYVLDGGERPFTVTTQTAYGPVERTGYYRVYEVNGEGAEAARLMAEAERDLGWIRSELQGIQATLAGRAEGARTAFVRQTRPHVEALRRGEAAHAAGEG